MLLKARTRIFLIAAIAAFLAAAKAGYAREGLKTYLSVAMEMPTHEFKLGEPVTGRVIVSNAAPSTLFGSFEVKLYKDEELRYTTTVYLKTIFTGTNPFQFKNFGIPKLKKDETSVGLWKLVIHPANHPEMGAEEAFRVGKESEG